MPLVKGPESCNIGPRVTELGLGLADCRCVPDLGPGTVVNIPSYQQTWPTPSLEGVDNEP